MEAKQQVRFRRVLAEGASNLLQYTSKMPFSSQTYYIYIKALDRSCRGPVVPRDTRVGRPYPIGMPRL
jgi:hypothetical protein